jgi:hypothetical protein
MMAGNISTALATALLNSILRDTAFTLGPQTVYLAAYTTDPTDDDVGEEVETEVDQEPTGYARVAVVFTDPAVGNGRECENDDDIEFPECLIDWGLITHVGLRTHSEAGEGDTLLFHGPLATPKDIGAEDVLRFKAGRIVAGFLPTT